MAKVILEFVPGPLQASGRVELYILSDFHKETFIGAASWPAGTEPNDIGHLIGRAISHAIKEGSIVLP